jgi:hypothetical protein
MKNNLAFSEIARRSAILFVPLAVGLTLVMAVASINEQQILRLGANEPQEWMADDVVAQIESGATPANVATGIPVALESGSGPFIIVFDANGTPVAGTGFLGGVLPTIPRGVFDAARNGDDSHFVTWQPESGVREAIVVEPFQATGKSSVTGFVVAGRSLAYTEYQENLLYERTFLGWFGTMLGTLIIATLAVTFLLR